MIVLGAGLQGSACCYDLLQQDVVERVTLADVKTERLPAFLKPEVGKRLAVRKVDMRNRDRVLDLLRGHDIALCALPYYFGLDMADAAIEAGVPYCDLGGNTEIVFRQQKLHERAVSAGLTVVPDCGVAPGMVTILAAEGIRRFDAIDAVRIYVGGLPQHPDPPLNYQIVYSLEGALDYYTSPSWILRESRLTRVDALSDLESLDFPAPVGTLEAFHTGGGISTLPWKFEGRVRCMEYKTLRYPGHVAVMKPIRDLGLLDLAPVRVKTKEIVPRDVFISVVSPKLTKPEGRDLVALRVEVLGTKDGKPGRARWQLLDYYDEVRGISAMMRTTGYSLAITGLMLADGRIEGTGVRTPDEAVPYAPYVSELAARGIEIHEIP